MSNAINPIDTKEIDHVTGAGETGRKAGEDAAKAAGFTGLVVVAAGIVGSAIEDAAADLLSPKQG